LLINHYCGTVHAVAAEPPAGRAAAGPYLISV